MERERGFGFEHWGDPSRFDHDAWWEGPLEALVVALAVAFLVVAAVWVVRRLASRGATAGAAATAPVVAATAGGVAAVDPAVDLLRMRYARGEIDQVQFRQTLDDLAGPPAWPGESAGDETAPTAS